MGYLIFKIILVAELDGRTLLKTIQTYEAQIKTFDVRG